MKIFSLVFVLLFSIAAKSQDPPMPADAIFERSIPVSIKRKQKSIYYVSCVLVRVVPSNGQEMNDENCRKFFEDNFVIRHLVVDESKDKKNLENPGAEDFEIKYNGEGQGIPFWLVFDKDGKLLADSKIRVEGEGPEKGANTGCPANEKEVDDFISVLEKTTATSIQNNWRSSGNGSARMIIEGLIGLPFSQFIFNAFIQVILILQNPLR